MAGTGEGPPGRSAATGRGRAAARGARAALTILAAALAAGCSADDGDTTVPGPEPASRQAVVAELARASAAQGICYGWQLADRAVPVSRGSNLGESTPVDADPERCRRWVEVRAVVYYEDESSEAEDSATVDVVASPGVELTGAVTSWLNRFDLTDQAFVDDPALAISRAALALPLLVTEAGVAPPPPTPSAPPPDALPTLDDAGNDFWRDRWGFVVAAAALLLVGGLLLTIGLITRRARRP
jgi:hypothetical protein